MHAAINIQERSTARRSNADAENVVVQKHFGNDGAACFRRAPKRCSVPCAVSFSNANSRDSMSIVPIATTNNDHDDEGDEDNNDDDSLFQIVLQLLFKKSTARF